MRAYCVFDERQNGRNTAHERWMRAAPLVRVKAKITVKNTVRESLRRQHTEFLTVILALTLKSGFALMQGNLNEYHPRTWSSSTVNWRLLFSAAMARASTAAAVQGVLVCAEKRMAVSAVRSSTSRIPLMHLELHVPRGPAHACEHM